MVMMMMVMMTVVMRMMMTVVVMMRMMMTTVMMMMRMMMMTTVMMMRMIMMMTMMMMMVMMMMVMVMMMMVMMMMMMMMVMMVMVVMMRMRTMMMVMMHLGELKKAKGNTHHAPPACSQASVLHYLVVDTNTFLDDPDFATIQRIVETQERRRAPWAYVAVVCVIPHEVLRELDGLKRSTDSGRGMRARRAANFVLEAVRRRSEWVKVRPIASSSP